MIIVPLNWGIRAVYAFEGILLAWFAYPFLPRRLKAWQEALIGGALALLYMAAKCQIEKNVWMNMSGMVVIAAGYLLLRGGKLRKSLWLACVFSASVELGRVLVYGTDAVFSANIYYMEYVWEMRILSNLLKTLGIGLCRRYFRRYQRAQIQPMDIALIMVPFAYIFFMRLTFLGDGRKLSDEYFRLFAFLFMCAATLLSIWMVFFHVSSQANRSEAERLQRVMQENYRLARNKADADAEMMRMVHDFKHQLAAIAGPQSSAAQKELAETLMESVKRYEMIRHTGNPVLDSLINHKVQTAAEKGVELNLAVQEALTGFMDELDLCALFGNALDNAIEAAEKNRDPEERRISVKAVVLQGVWVLKVENMFEKAPVCVDGRFQTNKPDAARHGIGLKSIAYCAEKYGGRMEAQARDRVFTLRVAIPVPAAS